jgi:hypothetical protein
MLGESVWNERAEAGAKNERAKWELENKLLPLSAFFFLYEFFFFVFFFPSAWEEEDARRKRLKWKCKSEKVGAKNERVK